MTNSYVRCQNLGMFLIRLDVIDVETLAPWLKSRPWQVKEWTHQACTNLYAWHNPGYDPGCDISTFYGAPVFENASYGQKGYAGQNIYTNLIKFMVKLDIILPEHTMVGDGKYK